MSDKDERLAAAERQRDEAFVAWQAIVGPYTEIYRRLVEADSRVREIREEEEQ
jgi:hypothetical protein